MDLDMQYVGNSIVHRILPAYCISRSIIFIQTLYKDIFAFYHMTFYTRLAVYKSG